MPRGPPRHADLQLGKGPPIYKPRDVLKFASAATEFLNRRAERDPRLSVLAFHHGLTLAESPHS